MDLTARPESALMIAPQFDGGRPFARAVRSFSVKTRIVGQGFRPGAE